MACIMKVGPTSFLLGAVVFHEGVTFMMYGDTMGRVQHLKYMVIQWNLQKYTLYNCNLPLNGRVPQGSCAFINQYVFSFHHVLNAISCLHG